LRSPFFVPHRLPLESGPEVASRSSFMMRLSPDAARKFYPTSREEFAPHVRSGPDGQAFAAEYEPGVPDFAD